LHDFKKLKSSAVPSKSSLQALIEKCLSFSANLVKKSTKTLKSVEKVPKPALKKREVKSGVKGSVKFNEKVEVHTFYERSWNDYKKKDFSKGAFQPSEVDSLLHSLCQYASELENPTEILRILCSKSKTEMPSELYGAWPKIAECLPNRTVQACHNLCRRRFNPENYSGKWHNKEEEILRRLVAKNGSFWKEVAQQYNLEVDEDRKRTPGNLKDKWKQMGADNYLMRNRGPWSLQEALTMFNLVCKAT